MGGDAGDCTDGSLGRHWFAARFEGQRGSNPEELIGAAHASCFTMALSLILGEAKLTAEQMDTSAEVTLEEVAGGWAITASHLTLKAKHAARMLPLHRCFPVCEPPMQISSIASYLAPTAAKSSGAADVRLLTQYDMYYLDRRRERPLVDGIRARADEAVHGAEV